nr:DUF4276 family protein [Desulfobulbaceae bacterium]
MSNIIEVVVLVEGQTEQKFIKDILAPYLYSKQIYLKPIIFSKPGQKGGDVRFDRVIGDIGLHLKQRSDTYLTLLFDYYGIKGDWPGLLESKKKANHHLKAQTFIESLRESVLAKFKELRPELRFIPYIAMHEFEALLFSSTEVLAEHLHVNVNLVESILSECGEPENINDSPETAPSKRLDKLSSKFKKMTTGISIAKEIGIDEIRKACPLFNKWVKSLEALIA